MKSTLAQSAWTTLLRNFVLPAGDRVFKQRMISRLKWLEQAQWWPRERILQHRDESLRTLMQITYSEVPFYRELMDTAGVRPEDIRYADDLCRLPVVTKSVLRAGYPDRVSRKTGFKTYVESTSGSTGNNFYVLEDTDTAGWYRASFLLALEWTGWKIGEPHLQTGMTLKRPLPKRLKDSLLGCNYASAYDLRPEHVDEVLDLMDRRNLQYLWGYPGSLYVIARRAAERGWNRPLRSAVSWGDMLYPQYRTEIESAFQTRVFDTYGCAEGVHIAAQCGEAQNYHLHSLDVIVECLDDNNQPVAPGEPGDVVLTRLHAGPMPLIRYRNGDRAILRAGECTCGRGYELLDSIQGRDTDILVTPSGNQLIVHFFTGILEHFREIREFQVEQAEPAAMTLRIVPAKDITEDTKRAIISALQSRGCADMRIDIELVQEIPLTKGGKRRFVINTLKQRQKLAQGAASR